MKERKKRVGGRDVVKVEGKWYKRPEGGWHALHQKSIRAIQVAERGGRIAPRKPVHYSDDDGTYTRYEVQAGYASTGDEYSDYEILD